MTEYEKRELEKAKRRATEQMREMQRRTSNNTSYGGYEKNAGGAYAPPADNQKGKNGFDLLSILNLKKLKFDNDIMLIIMMVFLLSTDESDELLLLALLYIML